MLNSIRLLINVVDINVFDVVTTRDIYAGSYPVPFHIQLWQDDKNERFIPDVSAVVKVQFLRMQSVGTEPASQTVVKTLTQTFTDDPSIWGCDLASVDVANIVTGGFRVVIEEGTDVTQIYSVMSIRKNPTSDWMFPEEDDTSFAPIVPIDSLWQRIGTTLSPVFTGDDLDMGTGNIDTSGLIDGRDVSDDGALLDAHLIDNAAIKHDADEIDVEGSYTYISTGRLEPAIKDIDDALIDIYSLISAESIWDRTGTVINPQNAGDDLDMGAGDIAATDLTLSGLLIGGSSPFEIQSREVDGVTACAFKFNTQNQLLAAGAEIFALFNKDVKVFAIDKDGNITLGGIPTYWSRTGTDLSPVNVGDSLKDITDITLSGTVDGRDVSVDGGILDAHVTDGSIHFLQTAIDHGNLLGRGDDDHVQYILATGSRAFTGAVSGVAPTLFSHLTTKEYVDALVQGISWQEPVLDKDLITSPPPVTGHRYIIAGTGGDWSGFAINDIVEYNGSSWDKWTPTETFAAWVQDEDVLYVYNGAAWVKFGSTVDHGNLTGRGDDDHLQYLLVNGIRAMAGGLDMGTNAITNVGNVDGRDVSADGSALDSHLNGGANKHDADEIDVEGVYTYIGAGDLEAAVQDIDDELGTLHDLITTEDIWNRVGTTISSKNAGDDLDLGTGKLIGGSSPLIIESKETDGAGAVGFRLNTQNELSTNGSVILELLNDSVDTLKIRRGEDLSAFLADATLVEHFNPDGTLLRQFAVGLDGDTHVSVDLIPAAATNKDAEYWAEVNTDFTYGDNYSAGFIDIVASRSGFSDNIATLATERYLAGVKTGYGSFGIRVNDITAEFELSAGIDNLNQLALYKGFAQNKSGIFTGKSNVRHYWDVDEAACLGIDADRAFIGKTDTSKWRFESLVADGATAIAYELDTFNVLSNAAAKLLSIKIQGAEKLSLDKDGNLNTTGGLSATSLTLSAGMELNRTAVAADYDVLATDYYLGVNTAVPIQIRLMSAIRSSGKVIEVKDEFGSAGVNNITVVTEGAETIDGAVSYIINVNRGAVRFICDGVNWHAL